MAKIVRGIGRVLAWVLTLAASAVAVVVTAPDLFALTMTLPVVQVIAFRGLLGLGFLAFATVLLPWSGRRLRARRRSAAHDGSPPGARVPARRAPSAAVALGVVLLVTGAVQLGVAAMRGVVNAPPTADTEVVPGDVTVLAFNTYVGRTPAEAVAAVAVTSGADVIALPETPPEVAAEIAGLLGEGGNPMQVFSNDRGYSTPFTTSLLVSRALGRYAVVPTAAGVGYVRADPVAGDGPPIVAAHPAAPTPRRMHWWTRELVYAVELCREIPGVVVAGDFNATLDHGPMRDLGRCVAAGAAQGWRGSGALGTWPAWLPALLGAPIDHVLVDGDAWAVDASGVVEVGDSDHRGVVARLLPVG